MMTTRLAALLAAGMLALTLRPAVALGQDVMEGERLPESMLDHGFIESMEAVLARDREIRARGPQFPKARGDKQGVWTIPSERSTYFPRSGRYNVVNKWGDTRMGIGFPGRVEFHGVWVAGQAGEGVWARGVRLVGFRDGEEIDRTDWFTDIDREPAWLAADFEDVDRIEVQAIPAHEGAGWYALDDLAYTPRSEDGKPGVRVVLDFEDTRYRQKLTGTGYRGLTWETGTGDFAADDPVDAPITERDDADGDGTPPPVPVPDGGVAGGGGALPVMTQSFQGIIRGDAGSFSYPPDHCGAVGPDHYVEVANRNFSVYLKSNGARVINTTLGAFLPGSNGDPRVTFDQYTDRWIVLVTDFDDTMFLGISMTSDPTGDWFKPSFIASADSDANCWPDYPTLGVDQHGIYISALMVGCGRSIFALEKAPLVAPDPSLGAVTAFRNLGGGTIQPAHTYGFPGSEFFVSRSSSTSFTLRSISPPLDAPTLNSLPAVVVPGHSAPADVPALGSSTPLDSVDARIFNAVYRDGSLWCANHVEVNGRAAARWYQINPFTSSLVQSGTVSDPVVHYFFPGIAVNGNGDVVVGFSGAHGGQYAGAYYTGRQASDPPGQMAVPFQYREGQAAQNNIDSLGRNRWGDYSLTFVDPVDDTTFYTVQEYGHADNIWGTYVARLQGFGPPPPANFDCTNAAFVAAGATPFTTFSTPTDGPAEQICNFNGDNQVSSDVWFRYTAPCDGTYTVDLCGSSYNTKLAIYEQFCPFSANQAIACNDDFCGLQSQVTFEGNGDALYFIRVGGFEGEQGDGVLNITPPNCIPAPSNDACGTPLPLTDGLTEFTTIGATSAGPDEPGACGIGATDQIDNDVWFRYVATCDGEVAMSLCGSDFDTVIAVYGSTCPVGSGELIACNDDLCGLQSDVQFDAIDGALYRIRVGGIDGATGAGVLSVACGIAGDPCPGDTNDDGIVNVTDLVNVILDWDSNGAANGGDVNDDGIVNVSDLVEVILGWGKCR